MKQIDLEEILGPKELVLWQGQPNARRIFGIADIVILIVSSFFFFAFLYMMVKTMPIMIAQKLSYGKVIAIVITSLFFFVYILYVFAGRFVLKYFKNKQTYYIFTNDRFVIVDMLFGKRIRYKYIKNVSDVKMFKNLDKSGTLVFNKRTLNQIMFSNTGLEVLSFGLWDSAFAFYNIEKVEELYKLITDKNYNLI